MLKQYKSTASLKQFPEARLKFSYVIPETKSNIYSPANPGKRKNVKIVKGEPLRLNGSKG
jgi:hypothetical protein